MTAQKENLVLPLRTPAYVDRETETAGPRISPTPRLFLRAAAVISSTEDARTSPELCWRGIYHGTMSRQSLMEL
jgi:hypothetical protein